MSPLLSHPCGCSRGTTTEPQVSSGLQRIGVCMAEKNPITQPPSPPAPRPSPISCRYRHGPVPQLLPMISSQIVFSAFVKKKKKYYGEFQIYIKIKEYYTKPPYTHNKPSMSSQPNLFHLYLIYSCPTLRSKFPNISSTKISSHCSR